MSLAFALSIHNKQTFERKTVDPQLSFQSFTTPTLLYVCCLVLGQVLLNKQTRRQHSHQGCNTVDYVEYRWNTGGVQITHSPITLANRSFINLVYVFRCYSSPIHPVYVRCVDPSTLAFSLASHQQSSISLLFAFRFIDS